MSIVLIAKIFFNLGAIFLTGYTIGLWFKSRKPWFAKLIFTREGVEAYYTYKTEREARAYVDGFNEAKRLIEAGGDDDPLEDYQAVADQLEPRDE